MKAGSWGEKGAGGGGRGWRGTGGEGSGEWRLIRWRQ